MAVNAGTPTLFSFSPCQPGIVNILVFSHVQWVTKTHTCPRELRPTGEPSRSRFILNIPEEEFKSFDRLFFQIEQAHWFYLDFYRESNTALPNLNLKDFGAQSVCFVSLSPPNGISTGSYAPISPLQYLRMCRS